MQENIDAMADRFDRSLHVLMQNLGPHLISRAQFGLTPGQVFMLYFIQQEKQCSVSKLAEKMEVAPSSITVMVDRLENHGFVNRVREKLDRRVVKVELTSAGEEKLDQVLRLRKRIVQHCLAQLDLNELEPFVHTLDTLASIARAMDIKAICELSN